VGKQLENIQLKRKHDHCCVPGPTLQSLPDKNRQCNRKDNFLSLGFSLPLTGAQYTEHLQEELAGGVFKKNQCVLLEL
jgi:hypothetical protein